MSLIGLLFDVAGTDYVRHTQVLSTAAEALSLGDVGTAGYIAIRNLDSTAENYVEIRDGATGADVVKLRAGGVAIFELATSTPYAIAGAGTPTVEYLLIEA